MSGIIAYNGEGNVRNILLDGLRRLEYRGYDSAGIAIANKGRKKLGVWKTAGKLPILEKQLPTSIRGLVGIGHTRWASHGEPDDKNAHPHVDASGKIALVHNGIIENASALREQLQITGVVLASDTDSEVLAHLIAKELNPGPEELTSAESLTSAVRQALLLVRGTYGIAVISSTAPDTLVVARNGSPMILGIGNGNMWATSDLSAIAGHAQSVVHLDDGEIATLTPGSYEVTTLDATLMSKSSSPVEYTVSDYEKGRFDHFLQREIFDQPQVIQQTLRGRLDERFSTAHLGGLNLEARELLDVRRIKILGCGSAYYAGLAGANMIEQLARMPANAEPAAEFRYRNPIIERDTLYIAVSQSGETFDTLAAVREIRRKGGFVLGVVNNIGSTIAREVDGGIYLHAGPEVSVASTKTYSSALTAFSLLALMLGRLRDVSPQRGSSLVSAISNLPNELQKALKMEEKTRHIAQAISTAHSMFFIGRTTAYPMALEGAQKLKEISYIHAEAYPSTELKHGPLALVTRHTPCVAIIPDNDLVEKSLSSLEEIKARGALLITITDSQHERIDQISDHVLRMPRVEEILQPIVMSVPLQLLAYHTALILDRNIDQPRNLSKSVTVE